jgi:nucleotide-binding universal stress UspA family protein
MFQKILVPTDFSKYSEKVLECVRELPGAKEVVLLNVIGPADPLARVWDPGGRIEEAKVKLGEQKKILENRGLNVKIRAEVVMEGDIARVIQKVADQEKISLIAMSAKGKGVVEGIVLGNVAKNILRYGNTNLLLMRYKVLEDREKTTLEKFCSHPFSKVLCPTDLSDPAFETIAFVKGIQEVGEILLQHVVFRGETWKEVEGHVEEATNNLNAIGKEIERAGLKVKVQVGVGSPAEQISDFASEEDVSLIVMNAYGKGWLKQLTVGSTTYDVAKMADRPVLVVRAGQMV